MGTRLKNMCEAVEKRLDKLHTICPYAFLKKLGIIAESAIGGTMGSIYGVIFENGANMFGELPESETVTPSMWLKSFSVGVEAVKKYTVKMVFFRLIWFFLDIVIEKLLKKQCCIR